MSISVLEALRPFKKPALIALVGLGGLLVGVFIDSKFNPDTAPIQPINFSHKVHAGDNEIPCQYCHAYAARTPSAGVPSVNKCIGCHNYVASDQPEIQKVAQYWEDQEPIPWIKVYDTPDFVHFTHKRHIQAELECQECHGPVETMDVVERQSSLKMPWCVSCHTKEETENGRDCYTCHK